VRLGRGPWPGLRPSGLRLPPCTARPEASRPDAVWPDSPALLRDGAAHSPLRMGPSPAARSVDPAACRARPDAVALPATYPGASVGGASTEAAPSTTPFPHERAPTASPAA